MKLSKLFAVFLLLSLVGGGCTVFSDNSSQNTPAGPKPANLTNATPKEASERINFVVGSQIEILQTAAADPKESNDGLNVRIVTIDRFAPMYHANLNWKLTLDAETQQSIQTRQNYQEQLRDGTLGDNPPPEPTIVTERQTINGVVDELSLSKTHNLFLPAYWPPDEVKAGNNSGIWLSDNVYEEIKKTGDSTIYYGMTDSSLYGLMSQSAEFSAAIKDLQKDVAAIVGKVDPDLVTVTSEAEDWQLYVNGEQVTVSVIKARNWYGEMVILDNKQNPLILKMTFDPQNPTNLEASGNLLLLKSLLSYEITRLSGVQ